MLGIQEIATFIPDNCVDNLSQADQFEAERGFVEKKIGVLKLPRFSESDSVTSACVESFRALSAKTSLDTDTVECVVVCTQNPDNDGLPHNAAIVHAALDMGDDCACFDIGLGCSGYVYGLSIIKSFMQSNGMTKGLLFTCDPYSKILDPADKSTSLLFGDAASVTLISDTPRYVEVGSKFSTRGSGQSALQKMDGQLVMNGRAVFNFALVDVPKQIEATLAMNQIAKSDIDLFVLHQGSRFMLENTIKRAAIPMSKAPIALLETGNTVSSSIPIILEKKLSEMPGLVLLSGFGVGLSWATTIYKRYEGSAYG